ncbi:MAG: hypothetical protein V1928_00140 [Parcubacteria group bacterium]
MKGECKDKCETCAARDLCPIKLGKSRGLSDDQIREFMNLTVQYYEKYKEFLRFSGNLKNGKPDEKIDMDYLEKHYRQPNVFQLVQVADIYREMEHSEPFDLIQSYYIAFVEAMTPANRAKFIYALSQNHEKAVAVRNLIIARGNQLLAAFRQDCPFQNNKQCQTCWLREVCKIKVIAAK